MNLDNTREEYSTADFRAGETCPVLIDGETFEVWENPDLPFGNDEEDLDVYRSRERWDLLWNALVLAAQPALAEFV